MNIVPPGGAASFINALNLASSEGGETRLSVVAALTIRSAVASMIARFIESTTSLKVPLADMLFTASLPRTPIPASLQ
jgi:carbon monoxide dehydrogenase subunit G